MSALETRVETPTPTETITNTIMLIGEHVPAELQAWAEKAGLRIERSAQLELDRPHLEERHTKWMIIDLGARPGARAQLAFGITNREREILELIAAGLSNAEIGTRLAISIKTVEAHRSRLFKKLGAANAPHAVKIATRGGLLFP